VRLIASGVYAPLAAGLEFAPLSVDPARVLRTDEGQAWLAGGTKWSFRGRRIGRRTCV
jgi:sterol 3beta-glucosyltransferase